MILSQLGGIRVHGSKVSLVQVVCSTAVLFSDYPLELPESPYQCPSPEFPTVFWVSRSRAEIWASVFFFFFFFLRTPQVLLCTARWRTTNLGPMFSSEGNTLTWRQNEVHIVSNVIWLWDSNTMYQKQWYWSIFLFPSFLSQYLLSASSVQGIS